MALLSLAPVKAGLVEGLGAWIAEDYATAFRELRPLAEAGNVEAQRFLADMYENGRGTELDTQEAVKWYTRAAQQDDVRSQTRLGAIYFEGSLGQPDLVQAAKWFAIAGRHDDTTGRMARSFLGLVEKQMSQEAIAEAESMAAAWLPG